jgi:hypothetical protein
MAVVAVEGICSEFVKLLMLFGTVLTNTGVGAAAGTVYTVVVGTCATCIVLIALSC